MYESFQGTTRNMK